VTLLETLSPEAIPQAIKELNQWRIRLTELVRRQAGFAFAWAEKNGGVPKTDEAVRKLHADFAERFPNDTAVDKARATKLLRERYEAWATEAGVTTCTQEDFERFAEETNDPHRVLFSEQVSLVQRISAHCEELSRAAVALECDDVTATLLRSIGSSMIDVDEGRLLLSDPSTWTEAHQQAGALLQNRAIRGVPLNHASLDVALDRLELAATKKMHEGTEDVQLSGRQEVVLQALLEMKAFDSDSRESTPRIAKAAEGEQADPNSFKEPISDLVTKKLVKTKSGRGGGCWLTPLGRVRAEKLAKR
jgi:hypothetical protein